MLKLYVCGPTVYSTPHIGNLRPVLSYDMVTRALKHLNRAYFYVHNITDIDDKIIEQAKQRNVTERVVSTQYLQEYLSLLKKYHVQRPTRLPTVSQNLPAIIKVIKNLLKVDAAYEVADGIYFDITKATTYGEVSHQNLAAMQFEDSATLKRHPADFVLWKKPTEGLLFDSPWGAGRPGWHTECVALISKYFKNFPIDVHGGGIDLRFPHHENENAQFWALTHQPITKTWHHSGQLYWDGAKMSKSLGNVIDGVDFANDYGADTLRLIIFNSAFASPINLTLNQINEAQITLAKWQVSFNRALLVLGEQALVQQTKASAQVAEALVDFDFAKARTFIQALIKSFNTNEQKEAAQNVILGLKIVGFVFSRKSLSQRDKLLYNLWVDLKNNKQFTKADALRTKLQHRKLI